MKLSMMTLFMLILFKGETCLRDVYRQVADAGFDRVDLSSFDLELASGSEIQMLLGEMGLGVTSYIGIEKSANMNTSPHHSFEAVKRDIDLAAALGAGLFMYVPSGYKQSSKDYDRARVVDALMESFRMAVEYASEKGVVVAVENADSPDFPMSTAHEVLHILENVPGLKLIYDSVNMITVGEDPVWFYQQVGKHVTHIHLRDFSYSTGDSSESFRPGDLRVGDRRMMNKLHGDGIMDIPALLRCIKQSGYNGCMTVEYVPQTRFFAEEMARCGTHLTNIWNSIQTGGTGE